MAYRDALSFRSSHYFVSFLSELTALSAGIDTSTAQRWTVTITRPWHVELPRSLVEVVIHWNVPMHTWLKTCKYKYICNTILCFDDETVIFMFTLDVFRVARPYGTFFAIVGTYGISGMLFCITLVVICLLLIFGMTNLQVPVTKVR